MSLSPKSLYAQVLYYETLDCALFLEDALNAANLQGDSPKIKLFNGDTRTFNLTRADIVAFMDGVKAEVQKPVNVSAKTGFYDVAKGRFIEGFNMHGAAVDFGSTIFNNMVISAGMATEAQAKSVCAWINGDRIVEGDNAKGHAGDYNDSENYGIYDYAFAPRITTVKNRTQYTEGHAAEARLPYSASCQDGGAILFTSYYDLIARFKTNGTEDAFSRLSEIRDWYIKIYNYALEAGDEGSAFYRGYYRNEGITLQGGGTAGTLGLDTEFLESAILYSVVPFAFFGLKGLPDGSLSVTPSLPEKLTFWRMENLMFNNIKYDLQMGKNYLIIESVRGDTSNRKITVNFNYSGTNPSVYVNGVKLNQNEYDFDNGVVSIKTDFSAKKLEVK